jgi:hypothetical protein
MSDKRVGVVLAVLVSLTVLFLALSVAHRRPMEGFELRASSFSDFAPNMGAWTMERRLVSPDPIEPNILCYSVTPRGSAQIGDGLRGGMILRLVHGYNVRDCMRIKGYRVEEIRAPQAHPPAAENSALGTSTFDLRTKKQEPNAEYRESNTFGQLWRMVSSVGVTSLWATAMLRADTFEATDRDVCSMPFPRVGIPDDPDWSPGGITIEGLRHPLANARRVVRAKWNASRSDLLTFLGFRRPTWVQAEWLTLVVAGELEVGSGEDLAAASLLSVRAAFVRELLAWKRDRGGSGP